jgi:hypothetical protein
VRKDTALGFRELDRVADTVSRDALNSVSPYESLLNQWSVNAVFLVTTCAELRIGSPTCLGASPSLRTATPQMCPAFNAPQVNGNTLIT